MTETDINLGRMVEPISIDEIISNTNKILEHIRLKNSNELILVDSNVISTNSLLPNTYHCTHYGDLDTDILKETIRELDFGLNVLSNKNIYVTKEISRELELFFRLVHEKGEFYKKIEKIEGKNNSENEEWKENYFSKLENLAEQLSLKSKGKIYHPSNKKGYDNFIEITETFKDTFDLMPKKRGIYRSESKERILKSAEEITAAALYHSFVEEAPCSVISLSTGVLRILKYCIIFMKSDKATKTGMCEYKPILERNVINLYSPVDNNGFLNPRISSKNLSNKFFEAYASKLF